MERNEEFTNMKALFEEYPEVSIHEKHGSQLKFPIYLTDSLANTDIAALDLSARAIHSLQRTNIHTIGDFCSRISRSNDLNSIRNCGKNSIAEIMDHLFAYQVSVLSKDRRKKYLEEVIRMNSV